jgi:hypothetical protein
VPTLLCLSKRPEILAYPTIFKIELESSTRFAHNIVYGAYDIGQEILLEDRMSPATAVIGGLRISAAIIVIEHEMLTFISHDI